MRLQNVYGPGQSLTNAYTGIVALFSQLARSGSPIPLYEDGQVRRDFVFISDVAAAFQVVVNSRAAQFATYDVGSGTATSIEALATELARYYGSPPPVVNGKFRDGDVRHASCDIEATTGALPWSPRVDLASGLAELQDWIKTLVPAP